MYRQQAPEHYSQQQQQIVTTAAKPKVEASESHPWGDERLEQQARASAAGTVEEKCYVPTPEQRVYGFCGRNTEIGYMHIKFLDTHGAWVKCLLLMTTALFQSRSTRKHVCVCTLAHVHSDTHQHSQFIPHICIRIKNIRTCRPQQHPHRTRAYAGVVRDANHRRTVDVVEREGRAAVNMQVSWLVHVVTPRDIDRMHDGSAINDNEQARLDAVAAAETAEIERLIVSARHAFPVNILSQPRSDRNLQS